MLVCHCLAVFESSIRKCVRDGARTADEVADQCGAGSGCGGCREMVEAIVDGESAAGAGPCLIKLRDRVAA